MRLSKNLNNQELSLLLENVAAALKLTNAEKNKFRVIAYERASAAIEHLSSEAKDLYDDDKLTDVSGIGESIASHIGEIYKIGKSKHFESILAPYDKAMFKLLKIPGIGPKRAFLLAKKFKFGDNPVKELEILAKAGKVKDIEGFEEKTEEQIEKSIKEVRVREKRGKRFLFPYAEQISLEIIKWMKKEPSVKQIDPLGSLRRKVSTVGDIDLSVSTSNSKETLNHFVKYPKSKRTVEKGEKTATILLPQGIRIDLIVSPPETYGSLLQHFTGSKQHNIALREYAKSKGLSLSEYGIKKVSSSKKSKFNSEKAFYNFLDLKWIPSELREDTGEIESAKINKLPNLVELKDIKGDFQIHTNFDIETSHDVGESSMEEIVKKAEELNYDFVAFTDHNPSKSGHNEKQIVELIKKRSEKIKGLKTSIKVFNSLEIDILPDGSLPVSEEGLKFLDFALVSIHSSFGQEKSEMTERILRALDNPKVKIFAHPTARKIQKREGVEANWKEVFDFCKERNIWIEINADPMRLDLPDHLVKEALDSGVKLVLGTDSHHIDSMPNMAYGVSVARRGWAEKKNIINTFSLSELNKMI